MDIHKPKPWRGFREFLKEYLIIVVGVLTALGGEQAAEWLHWRHAVSEARQALHDEIGTQTSYFRTRVLIGNCVDRHLADLSALIEQATRDGRKPTVSGVAIRTGAAIDAGEWAAEQAAQTLVHFPAKERSQLATFYRQTEDLVSWRDEEGRLLDELAVLDGPSRTIPEAELSELRMKLRRVARLEALWTTNAKVQLERARAMGVPPAAPRQGWENRCQNVAIAASNGGSKTEP